MAERIVRTETVRETDEPVTAARDDVAGYTVVARIIWFVAGVILYY